MGKEPQQTPLGSNIRKLMQQDACFVMRARRLSRLVSRTYDDALRRSGLTGSQFTLLFSLAAMGPQQAVTIATELDIEKSTMSRTVNRMIQSGWLEERKEKARPKVLALTSEGEQVLNNALPYWQKAQNQTREIFQNDGSAALDQLISKAQKI